jgi:hypothetical protein
MSFDVVEPEQAYARVGDTLGLPRSTPRLRSCRRTLHGDQLAKAALLDELSALTVAIARDAVLPGE